MRKGLLLLIAVLVVGVIPFIGIIEAQTLIDVDESNYRSPIVGGSQSNPVFEITRFDCPYQGEQHQPFGWQPGRVLMDINVIGVGNDDEGVPIYSSGNGEVRLVNLGQGLVQIENTEMGNYYGHLAKIHVSTGQTVAKGQLIGFMGNVGPSSLGVHLHWETYPMPGYSFEPRDIQGVEETTRNNGGCTSNTNDGYIWGSPISGFSSCEQYYNQGYPEAALFDHANCQGNLFLVETPNVGFRLYGSYDERIRSLYVPPGKSVFLAADAQNPLSSGRCTSIDMWNLDAPDYYDDANNSINWDSNPQDRTNSTVRMGWNGGTGANMVSWVMFFDNPSCFINGAHIRQYLSGQSVPQIGGYDYFNSGNNWLLEFAKSNNSLFDIEIHTRVDISAGNYSAHRVLVDGQNIGETATAEQYITWNTFGWADGYHTMRVEYRRQSDNGNWANALSYEEQFYLSPNRNGTAPCDGRDGIEMSSGSDCIILLQSFPALDVIGWKERQPLTVTVRGNFEAWFEYSTQPQVVVSGETRSMGLVTQVELRTPAPPPPPPPSSAFTVDANTVYLFPFNEGAGTQTVDIASGLTGDLGSGVGWVPGRFENALLFPNPNDGRGVTTSPFETCSLTVELWVRSNSNSPARLTGQLGGGGNSGQNKWLLALDGRRPKFEIWSAGGSQWITSSVEIQAGTWHYIMATYDCVSRQAKLYLDNQLVGEFLSAAPWNGGATTFEIGAAEGIYRCACEIDEIRISNTIRVPSTEPTATATSTPSPTASPTVMSTNTVEPTVTPMGASVNSNGTGLTGYYFNGTTFSGPSEVRVDPIINIVTHSSPHPFVGADNFSIRWTGFIEPRYTEQYLLCTWSDDGIRVILDGQIVIENWVAHGDTEDCANVSLLAGMEYSITIEYYENGGGAVAQLVWSSQNQEEELVPQSQLYPAPVSVETATPTSAPSATPVPTSTETPVATATETAVPTSTETPVPQSDVLLSQGMPITANTQKGGHEAQYANDGDMDTYWEGENYTNSGLTVDLGAVYTINSIVMKLGWEGRQEQVTIWTSTDGVNFTQAVPAEYYFLGTEQVQLPSINARYVGLEITDNSAAPAAQMAEFEVWGH